MKILAKAKVQVVLEIETSAWGEECAIGQLYKQAAESGIQAVQRMVQRDGSPAKIIGEPKVIGVITEVP